MFGNELKELLTLFKTLLKELQTMTAELREIKALLKAQQEQK